MIKDPKRDGYYQASSERFSLFMVRRYGCGWWCEADRGAAMGDTNDFQAFVRMYQITRIEPVPPPSWEKP